MLEKASDRSRIVRKVAVVTGRPALTELLQHLLRLWDYEISSDTAEALLLAEEGRAEPMAGQKVLWLSGSTGREQGRIGLPIELEKLWQTLEHHFHQPPRMHIRMKMDADVMLKVGAETVSATLSNLSDMGCRVSYRRELVRGQQVLLDLAIDGELLKIDSEVIYAIPGASTDDPEVRLGLLFAGMGKERRDRLRCFLIRRYLEQVREKHGRRAFRIGTGRF